MYIKLIFTFIYALALLFFLRKVARTVGLVDKPTKRKQHSGDIPLVGGIALFITLAELLLNYPYIFRHSQLYLTLGFILVLVGAIDDRFDLNYRYRLLTQIFVALAMAYWGHLSLTNLGNILFWGNIDLGGVGWFITIIAVVASINAFNMVDGINGLLGVLSSISFGSLAFLLFIDQNYRLAYFCLALIVMIFPYILFNMGLLGRKRQVFMGDAGSMLIGYTIVWLLFIASQESVSRSFRPVTALWLIAIPLMDMGTIMIRRIRKGCSPFKPDRQHIHHIFQRMGFNPKQTLFIITIVAILLSAFGIIGEIYKIKEAYMFIGFCICWIGYYLIINRSWRLIAYIRLKMRVQHHIKN